MTMTAFAVFDGDVFLRGGNADAAQAVQQAGPGEQVYLLPQGVLTYPAMSLTPLRDALSAQVDREAGDVRLRYITDVPGQLATYLAKEAEAKAWSPAADPAEFPYLTAEAAAIDLPIADLVAEIDSVAAAWRALDPLIEAARRGAKVRIATADTIPAIFAASQVDWPTAG